MLRELDVDRSYLFVADGQILTDQERTLLVLNTDSVKDDESEEPNSFRVVLEQLA